MSTSPQVVIRIFHHDDFTPLEPAFGPFLHRSNMMESDSDIDSNPHLSEGFTETDNDTPPETPLRAKIELTGEDQCTQHRTKEAQNGSCGRTPVMPAPAHFSEPLQIATPDPIRPVPYAIRSFGCSKLEEDDRGYDSEREGRPGLRKFRSFQSLAIEQTNLLRNVLDYLLERLLLWFDSQEGQDVRQKFRHSRIILDPLSPEEEAQLWSDLVTCPLEDADPPATDSKAKDRSNESTGLGLGLPVALEGGAWRMLATVPRQSAGMLDKSPRGHSNNLIADYSPECANTPGIYPILYDDTDLSPLNLPQPLVSPAMTEWGNWDIFYEVDDKFCMRWRWGHGAMRCWQGLIPCCERFIFGGLWFLLFVLSPQNYHRSTNEHQY
ncbi:hypothetical protein RHS01_08469 [Rhizoctonia solani]|uniref:Uncharacterized protein n=1 Tax=Rhizoctonia solani TaxID=456999 RepID=A0A8H7I747_9AGAM|nr:hypothetical protein RHS01_08469 [Rhizoctonia solani]